MSLRLTVVATLTLTIHVAAPQLSEACLGGRDGPVDLNPSSTLLESASPGPIVIRADGTYSVLHLRHDLVEATPGELLRRAGVTRRLFLLLCDLRAAQTPETLFHIYLNLPEHADQATRASHLLAQFNFFGAIRPGDTTMSVWQSFDVTHTIDLLTRQGVLETKVMLTILAVRPFDPQSRPSVGRIALVQQ